MQKNGNFRFGKWAFKVSASYAVFIFAGLLLSRIPAGRRRYFRLPKILALLVCPGVFLVSGFMLYLAKNSQDLLAKSNLSRGHSPKEYLEREGLKTLLAAARQYRRPLAGSE